MCRVKISNLEQHDEKFKKKLKDIFEESGIYIFNENDVFEIEELDSITKLSLLSQIEQEFGIQFSKDELLVFCGSFEMLVENLRKMCL